MGQSGSPAGRIHHDSARATRTANDADQRGAGFTVSSGSNRSRRRCSSGAGPGRDEVYGDGADLWATRDRCGQCAGAASGPPVTTGASAQAPDPVAIDAASTTAATLIQPPGSVAPTQPVAAARPLSIQPPASPPAAVGAGSAPTSAAALASAAPTRNTSLIDPFSRVGAVGFANGSGCPARSGRQSAAHRRSTGL